MIPRLSEMELLTRKSRNLEVELSTARRIIDEVRTEGDAALIRFSLEFDGVTLEDGQLEVSSAELASARLAADPGFIDAIEHAAANVREFHRRQLPTPWSCPSPDGGRVGRMMSPVQTVGIYVPGGTAAYPSSVVMTAVPAKVAGVPRIVMCTPPGPGGRMNPHTLAAALVCGVDRVFRIGGAQAIAAMAYGTQTVPRADKLVGPGNAFVTAAKRLIYGDAGIDMLAGPSEVLIIADAAADPSFVAADLLAQAEHDPLAAAMLITTSQKLADRVQQEITRQISSLSRRDIIEKALASHGAIVVVPSIGRALDIANSIAPEHLEIMTEDPHALAQRVVNAGTVFLGPMSPEPIGDYIAGPNHVLPTMGSARYIGGLGTADYVKPINFVEFDGAALVRTAKHALAIAGAEGLTAHANSIEVRLRSIQEPRHRRVIKLDANESPYDLPPIVKREILNGLADLAFNRYPSEDAGELRRSIASSLGVREEMIVAGVGSDELIQMIILARREVTRTLVTVFPTFTMYARIAQVVGVPVCEIPLLPDFSMDVAALEREVVRGDSLVFLCNPNNPTGTRHTEEIRTLLQQARGMVVVDEAYYDFLGETILPAAPENVIVLRTLSKAFSLAGLRVGYGVMAPEVARDVERARLPYNCSSASIIAARKVLEHATLVREAVEPILRERDRLAYGLSALGAQVVPSHTNFVLFRPNRPAQEVYGLLAEEGIAVRRFDRLPDYLRVTAGLPEETDAFLDAMARVCAGE